MRHGIACLTLAGPPPGVPYRVYPGGFSPETKTVTAICYPPTELRKAINMEGCAPKIPPTLTTPSLNRGVGFTHQQRRKLGLTGRLPSGVLTLDEQAERVWRQLQSMPTDLARNVLLDQLHSRHEILYFKVLAEHLTELMPVVYTPTVGEAIQRFSEEYRGQRGLYLSIEQPDQIADSFDPLGLGIQHRDLRDRRRRLCPGHLARVRRPRDPQQPDR